MISSPFKFLDSFGKEDKNIYFGRERETEELYQRVFESRLLLIYGVSGTGKSSLIHCGLANKFNDSDWLPVNIRRGTNINKSFKKAITHHQLTPVSEQKSIFKHLQSLYLDHFKPVYLIFDQFEEMFIFGTRAEREEFILLVKEIIDSDLNLRFLFVIREEYLANMTEFEEHVKHILNNRIRIEKMTRANAINCIEGPCNVAGIELDPGFSEELLDKLTPNAAEVELTYLQVYLDKLFRTAVADGNQDKAKFTLSLLAKTGNVSDLLGSFLDEQINQMDDPDVALVILKTFVSIKGTKRQITEEEVVVYSQTLGKNIGEDQVRGYLQKFVSLRILRDKDDNGRYELRHDALALKVFEQITLVEKELLEIRQFVENACNNYEKRGVLLSESDLKYIAPYEDKLFLPEQHLQVITKSKRELNKKRRRKRWLIGLVIITLLGSFSIFTVWALIERSKAIKQREVADQKSIEAKASERKAVKATTEALNLKSQAEKAREIAEEQSEIARKEAIEAEKQRKIAEHAIGQAKKARMNAEEQTEIAKEEAVRAEELRKKADKSKELAEKARKKAEKLTLHSIAQTLAFKSTTIENDAELQALLALMAYEFTRQSDENVQSAIVNEALRAASNRLIFPDELITSLSYEPRELMAVAGDKLQSAGKTGLITEFSIAPLKLGESYDLAEKRLIRHVVLGADNKVLCALENGKVKLFRQNKGKLQASILPDAVVTTAIFSATGKKLALAMENKIELWNSEAEIPVLLSTHEINGMVNVLVFSSDDILYYGTGSGKIAGINIRENKRLEVNSDSDAALTSLAYAEKNRMLAAGFADGKIIIVNLKSGAVELDIKQHQAVVENLVFNSDEKILASSSSDKTIKILDLNALDSKPIVLRHGAKARCMAFTGNTSLAAGYADKTVRSWELSSEQLAEKLCPEINRNLSGKEWKRFIGDDIPYQEPCR